MLDDGQTSAGQPHPHNAQPDGDLARAAARPMDAADTERFGTRWEAKLAERS